MNSSILERAKRYISTIYSRQGAGGSTDLLKAAGACTIGFMLPEETTFGLLKDTWNETNAFPPWTDAELRHKIRESRKGRQKPGFLLDDNRPATTTLDPAEKRRKWPPFRRGSDSELQTVAKLRHVSPGIAWTAQKLGLLRFTEHAGHDCFVLTEGTIAQVRRIDGKPFTLEGAEVKAKSLPGSQGRWLGVQFLKRHPQAPVVIGEGLVAWVEIGEAIDRSSHKEWIPFVSLNAQVALGREMELLAGRQIILAMDADTEGAKSVAKREAALKAKGIAVTIWTPPANCKDLGDALALPGFDANQIFNAA